MGYFISTIDACFVLERENYGKAFRAVCELNARDELKTGGRHPATEVKPEDSKSLGNPNVWFAWMPWDYDVTCSGIVEVFETLGFDVIEDVRGISCLWYDGKSGAEEVFFEAVAPYVKEGSSITLQGEDGALIRYSFDGKGVEQSFGEDFQEIGLYSLPQVEKFLRERGWASPEEIAARLSDAQPAVEKTRKTGVL